MRNKDLNIDCIFLHTGKTTETEESILIMPTGILALADLLEKSGFCTKILNISLAKNDHPHFSLNLFIKKCKPKLACIPLHWHQQSSSTINLAPVILP